MWRALRLIFVVVLHVVAVVLVVLWIRSEVVIDTCKYTRTIVSGTQTDKRFASIRSGSGRMYIAVSFVDHYPPSAALTMPGGEFEYYQLDDETRVAPFWQRRFGFQTQASGPSSRDWIIAAPHWVLLGLVAVPIALFWVRHSQKPAGDAVPCPQCGYDLRASAGRCPECGREILGPSSRRDP